MPHSTAQQHQGCTLHETSVSGSRTTCSHTHIHKYTQVHHNVPRSVVCRANTSGLLPRQPYRCWDHFRLCQRRREVSGELLHQQWHTRRSIRTGVGNLQSSQRPGIREFVNRSNASMRSASSLHNHAGTVSEPPGTSRVHPNARDDFRSAEHTHRSIVHAVVERRTADDEAVQLLWRRVRW